MCTCWEKNCNNISVYERPVILKTKIRLMTNFYIFSSIVEAVFLHQFLIIQTSNVRATLVLHISLQVMNRFSQFMSIFSCIGVSMLQDI